MIKRNLLRIPLGIVFAVAIIMLINAAQEEIVAIKGGKILTVTQGTIDEGIIIIKGSKIEAVGKDIKIPTEAKIIDAQGKWIMPGLIDAHTHVGISPRDYNETYDPVSPQIRITDGFYPFGRAFEGKPGKPRLIEMLEGGVTTCYITPHSNQVISGQGAVVKSAGDNLDEMIIKDPAGIKMAFGEDPKRTFGDKKKMPSTRMGVAAVLRTALIKAQRYMETWENYNKGELKKKPKVDLGMEALAKLLRKEIPARVHCHRRDDILTAIRIAEEFGFDLVLDHCTSGYLVADEIAKRKIAAVLGPITALPYLDYESSDINEQNAALLHKAGVKIAFASDSHGRSSSGIFTPTTGKFLAIDAAFAGAYGMPDEAILKALTINAAEILGVADRIGSLEPGKDADIIILDGHPLSIKTWTEKVFINGKLVYQKD